MKREIKFRIWIKQFMQRNPEMIYCNEDARNTDIYFCTGNNVFRTHDDWYAGYEVQDVTSYVESIMEYTGMKDKNGREIYEGDIVELFGWGSQKESDGFSVVEWDLDLTGWGLRNNTYAEDRYDFLKAISNCVVVGNIYEHPHLIKTE